MDMKVCSCMDDIFASDNIENAVFDIEKTATICNQKGLHARAAAAFVKLAGEYEANVAVQKDTHVVCGRSIMGLMMLAASKGTDVVVKASGTQAQEAVTALTDLISNRFNEEE